MRRLGGWLVADATYGLALRDKGAGVAGARVAGVFWPFGYTAHRERGGVVLVDRLGRVVATEGDRILMAGVVIDGLSYPCHEPELQVVP